MATKEKDLTTTTPAKRTTSKKAGNGSTPAAKRSTAKRTPADKKDAAPAVEAKVEAPAATDAPTTDKPVTRSEDQRAADSQVQRALRHVRKAAVLIADGETSDRGLARWQDLVDEVAAVKA